MSNPQRPPLIITPQPVVQFNQPKIVLAQDKWKQYVIQRGGANASAILELLYNANIITAFIAGGYARFCLSTREEPPLPDDLDVFFSRDGEWADAHTLLSNKGFVEIADTKNARTFHPPKTVEWEWMPTVQLISPSCKMFNGLAPEARSLRAILDRFDLNIAQAAVFLDETGTLKGVASESFHIDDITNKVTVNHLEDPFNTMVRLCKYSTKGFGVSKETIARILEHFHNMPQEARETYVCDIMREAHPY